MRSEIGGNWWWTCSHLLCTTGLTIILIIITLLVDGETPGHSILRVYNEIYIIVLPIYALAIPISALPILKANLQFGASRRELFYAIEITSGIVLVACALMVVGMNAFSRTIYDVVDTQVWNISALKWIFYFLNCKLLWVSSQRATYGPKGAMTKSRTFKWTFVGVLYVVSIIFTYVMTRATLEISPAPSANVVCVISAAVFVVMCIVIALVQRSNYRVFMKMEV